MNARVEFSISAAASCLSFLSRLYVADTENHRVKILDINTFQAVYTVGPTLVVSDPLTSRGSFIAIFSVFAVKSLYNKAEIGHCPVPFFPRL